MLLTGARVAINSETALKKDIWIKNDRISFSSSGRSANLDLHGFLLLPGLINAHDHLELNLFPRMGRGPYSNATAWANDIYRPEESPIRQHLAVPKSVRLLWGALKNLVSGVTTVGHHNALHPILLNGTCPIRVLSRYGWAHSIQFSPDWKDSFRNTAADVPFFIHASEGTDEHARREIHILDEARVLSKTTVLIHGVAAGPQEVSIIFRRGSSVVWCPTSNYFTLGRTLNPDIFDSGIPIALGTDSALTGEGDLFDELQVAKQTLPAVRLYDMVTRTAAAMLKLGEGFGEIRDGGPADLIAIRDTGRTPVETLLSEHPNLVIVGGRAVLAAADLPLRRAPMLRHLVHSFQVEGRGQYFTSHSIDHLISRTQLVVPDFRLAGKQVAA